MVELVAQAQSDAVALVEAGGHDASAGRDGAEGLVQGRVGAADLDGDVGAEAAGGFTDAFGDGVGPGVEGGVGAVALRGLQAPVEGVDGGDAGAVELGEAGGEQTDDALAEDGGVLAEVDVGGQDGVVGDGADAGEGAGEGLEAGGEGVADHAFGGDDAFAAVSPDAPDQVAGAGQAGEAVEVGGGLDDLADLGVAPAGHGVLDAGGALAEQAGLGIPGARQVRIRAAVRGEFGAGRYARVAGADPQMARGQIGGDLLGDLHLTGAGELDDTFHG